MKDTSTGKGARVLVVDDDASMRTTLVDILEAEGYTASAASSGESALEICSTQEIDVVLMDLRMPGMGGMEAFDRIRSLGRDTRIILMSAYGSDEITHSALDKGAVAFLPKPLQLEDVLKLIAAVNDAAILVVSDDDGTRSLMARELKSRGFRVALPETTTAALEAIRQVRFDIAFVDARLAGMSGLDFYLEFRRVAPSAVAIMMYEQALESVALEAVDRTAYASIPKPVEREQLSSLLDTLGQQRASGSVRKPSDGR